MNGFAQVPPGFRFHPTDEELVDYYLRKKVASRRIELDVIKDVDLYKIEPWDLQEICRLGTEEQNEWYFFSHKDKKYPTGTRTNRATASGFWKATGRDKAIYSKHDLIGMRKTLVFYNGRAPNGQKSDWIMHEYRLESDENGTSTSQEEGWVVCRVFKKKMAAIRRGGEHDLPCWYQDQASWIMMPNDMDAPHRKFLNPDHQLINIPSFNNHHPGNIFCCKKEIHDHLQYLNLPLFESSRLPQSSGSNLYGKEVVGNHSSLSQDDNMNIQESHQDYPSFSAHYGDQVTDWRVLDKFVASQLSHEEVSDGSKQETALENAASNCPMDLWK